MAVRLRGFRYSGEWLQSAATASSRRAATKDCLPPNLAEKTMWRDVSFQTATVSSSVTVMDAEPLRRP
jgi:hypothetical protein